MIDDSPVQFGVGWKGDVFLLPRSVKHNLFLLSLFAILIGTVFALILYSLRAGPATTFFYRTLEIKG